MVMRFCTVTPGLMWWWLHSILRLSMHESGSQKFQSKRGLSGKCVWSVELVVLEVSVRVRGPSNVPSGDAGRTHGRVQVA